MTAMVFPGGMISKQLVPLVLILLNFATGLVIDIYTPCLPSIQEYFHASQLQVRLTMIMLSTAATIGIPFWGPLSDRFGRKTILLIGQFIFILGLLGAIFASSIEMLIGFRFVQGVGTSAIGAVSFAMISDWFKGPTRLTYFSYIGATITLTLVIGPLIGGYLHDNWQGCFIIVLVMAIPGFLALMLCPESLTDRQPFSVGRTFRTYLQMATSLPCIGYAALAPLLIGALVSFAVNGAFYYMVDLGMDPKVYSWHQAFIMLINTVANISAGRLVGRWGEGRLIGISLILLGIAVVGLLIIGLGSMSVPILITGCISLISTALGFSFSIYLGRAMAVYPDFVGAASSFISLLRSLIIGITIAVSGWFYNHEVTSVTILPIIIVAVFYLILWQISRK
jgi:DHA1 family bicyclomycin/chloramphenicol resistance-like MFS transporter